MKRFNKKMLVVAPAVMLLFAVSAFADQDDDAPMSTTAKVGIGAGVTAAGGLAVAGRVAYKKGEAADQAHQAQLAEERAAQKIVQAQRAAQSQEELLGHMKNEGVGYSMYKGFVEQKYHYVSYSEADMWSYSEGVKEDSHFGMQALNENSEFLKANKPLMQAIAKQNPGVGSMMEKRADLEALLTSIRNNKGSGMDLEVRTQAEALARKYPDLAGALSNPLTLNKTVPVQMAKIDGTFYKAKERWDSELLAIPLEKSKTLAGGAPVQALKASGLQLSHIEEMHSNYPKFKQIASKAKSEKLDDGMHSLFGIEAKKMVPIIGNKVPGYEKLVQMRQDLYAAYVDNHVGTTAVASASGNSTASSRADNSVSGRSGGFISSNHTSGESQSAATSGNVRNEAIAINNSADPFATHVEARTAWKKTIEELANKYPDQAEDLRQMQNPSALGLKIREVDAQIVATVDAQAKPIMSIALEDARAAFSAGGTKEGEAAEEEGSQLGGVLKNAGSVASVLLVGGIGVNAAEAMTIHQGNLTQGDAPRAFNSKIQKNVANDLITPSAPTAPSTSTDGR